MFLFFASLLNRSPLLRERICSLKSKFFPLIVDPCVEELVIHLETLIGSQKICLPLKLLQKKHGDGDVATQFKQL